MRGDLAPGRSCENVLVAPSTSSRTGEIVGERSPVRRVSKEPNPNRPTAHRVVATTR